MALIVEAPNTILSSVSDSVKLPYSSDLARVISDMEKALLSASDPKGVGLAAPQIGIPLRIFITKPSEKSKIQVFINPEILSSEPGKKTKGKAKQKKLEGCLSLPTIWGTVKRSPQVKIKYLDEKGKEYIKVFKGFMAIIIQHEIDHLDGILFPRRVLEQKGQLYKSHKNEKNEDEFEEIEL